MAVAELALKAQTQYFLIPKGTEFSAPQSCSRIELDLSQAVDQAIAQTLNLRLVQEGLSANLERDRLGVCCDRQISDTSELGEFLQSQTFDIITDPPTAQQTTSGHIAYIAFASRCIGGSCALTQADLALLAE